MWSEIPTADLFGFQMVCLVLKTVLINQILDLSTLAEIIQNLNHLATEQSNTKQDFRTPL